MSKTGIGRTDSDLDVTLKSRGTITSLVVENIDSQGNIIEDGKRQLILRVDYDSSGNPIYVGEAALASASKDPVWRIKKITYDSSSNPVSVLFSSGSTSFTAIWDSRTTLSYS